MFSKSLGLLDSTGFRSCREVRNSPQLAVNKLELSRISECESETVRAILIQLKVSKRHVDTWERGIKYSVCDSPKHHVGIC